MRASRAEIKIEEILNNTDDNVDLIKQIKNEIDTHVKNIKLAIDYHY